MRGWHTLVASVAFRLNGGKFEGRFLEGTRALVGNMQPEEDKS